MPLIVTISGCSGGGKSTLIAELARRGHMVVSEPGRRIVRAALSGSDDPLPWIEPERFARRAIALAQDDLEEVALVDGPVFFDRGLVDAVSALTHLVPSAPVPRLDAWRGRTVFLALPWRELFVGDAERRHGFDDATAEYHRLAKAYETIGARVVPLPRIGIEARVAFVLRAIGMRD